MHRFTVYCSGVLIGHSALESGDPPMGVAFGRFSPLPAYEKVRQEIITTWGSTQEQLLLSVVDTLSGATLLAQGGVQIFDAVGFEQEEMELQVAGIPYPLYEQLFPGRYAAYEASLNAAR
jgi:hypothetical protein